MSKKVITRRQTAGGNTPRRNEAIIALLVLALLCMAGIAGYSADAASAEPSKAGGLSPAQKDFQSIEGRWVRPDGGYILELRDIKKDGTISAAYFNPRSIKVYRAQADIKKGKINVRVELRDINYPGSTYTLQYDPDSNSLKGKYFQAVERQMFDVEFLRLK